MSIAAKTKCGQEIIDTEHRISRLKSLIESISKPDSRFRTALTIEFAPCQSRYRNGKESFGLITREEVIAIINRTLKEKENALAQLNEQYKTID